MSAFLDADPPPDDATLAEVEAVIDEWAAGELADNPVVVAVERGEPGEHRWYIRVTGEEKDVFTIWLTRRQRMLHYETYFMPAPEENHVQLFEHLLIRNQKLVGAAFAIGDEDAVYLKGAAPIDHIDRRALDHILGLLYVAVEQCFKPAVRLAFASRWAASQGSH